MSNYLPRLPRERFVKVLMQLSSSFPKLFTTDEKQLKLMKVGIHAEIKAKTGISGSVLRLFMHEYCTMNEYIDLHKAGAIRYDLDGLPAGQVTAKEAIDKPIQIKAMLLEEIFREQKMDKRQIAESALLPFLAQLVNGDDDHYAALLMLVKQILVTNDETKAVDILVDACGLNRERLAEVGKRLHTPTYSQHISEKVNTLYAEIRKQANDKTKV